MKCLTAPNLCLGAVLDRIGLTGKVGKSDVSTGVGDRLRTAQGAGSIFVFVTQLWIYMYIYIYIYIDTREEPYS